MRLAGRPQGLHYTLYKKDSVSEWGKSLSRVSFSSHLMCYFRVFNSYFAVQARGYMYCAFIDDINTMRWLSSIILYFYVALSIKYIPASTMMNPSELQLNAWGISIIWHQIKKWLPEIVTLIYMLPEQMLACWRLLERLADLTLAWGVSDTCDLPDKLVHCDRIDNLSACLGTTCTANSIGSQGFNTVAARRHSCSKL